MNSAQLALSIMSGRSARQQHAADSRMARAAGALIALLGAAVLAGWTLDVDTLKSVLPGLVSMKANTAVCFLLIGAALFLHVSPRAADKRAVTALALAALTLALSTLVEYGAGRDLGIDQLLFRDPDTPTMLNPGRMAPITALGFLLGAVALVLARLPDRHTNYRALGRSLSIGTSALGGIGALGYLLGLEFLVSALPFRTIALHTAIGFMILGIGLLAVSRSRTPTGDDRRIAALAAWLLMGTAGAAGLASFAIIGGQVDQTLAQGLTFALESRIKAITVTVELRTTRAEIIGTRPDLLKHLRALSANPQAPGARAAVQEIIASFLPHGFSAIAVSLPGGAEIARVGRFLGATGADFRLEGGGDRSLVWQDGAYLRYRLPLGNAGARLGTLRVEQSLDGLDETLQMIDSPWRSAEFQLCRPIQNNFRCFPTRLTPRVFTEVPAPAGAPPRLIYRARDQGAGFAASLDYRMMSGLGAFNRVGDLGLVSALKVDAAEIYAPTARSFVLAAAFILCLALTGALLVRLQVRPLATHLEARVRARTAELADANEALQRAIAASYENETRFRALVDASAQIVWTTNADGLIVEDSPSWRTFTGQTYDQWKGVGAFDVVHPDDRSRLEQLWHECVTQVRRLNTEFRLSHVSGGWRWVTVRAVPLRDANRKVTGWIGSNTDITERKQAEEALQESGERLRLAVEASELGTFAHAVAADRLLLDERAQTHFGLSAISTLDRLVARIHPDDREAVGQARQAAHDPDDDGRYAAEYRVIDVGGNTRWLHVEAKVQFHGEGEFRRAVRVIGTSRDITEQKTAENKLHAAHEQLEQRVAERTAQLAESNEFMSTLLENIQDGIVACNAAGGLTLFNAATRQFHGLPQEDIPADQWSAHYDLYLPDGCTPMPMEQIPLYRALKGEHVQNVEMVIAPKGGEARILLASGQAFHGDDGKTLGAVASMHDITDRKRAETQLRALTAELARSNRELEDFARVASHDLQEPLRKVQAFGDLLATHHGGELNEEGRDYLDRMQGAAKRMSSLITDLLKFSRVSTRAQPFINVDLREVARDVLTDLEVHIASSGGHVTLGALPVIEADRLQMRQLLQNLIGNALKYQRPGVAPVVQVFGETEAESNTVKLYVTDNGIGFDIKYLDRIFVVFQRLHGRQEYEGTGVGLAICKKIAERHGGHITAESVPGAGATFIVTLPVRQQQAELPGGTTRS